MYSLIIVVLAGVSQIGVSLTATLEDNITKDTELIFAFMIHRHGDRTPIELKLINLFSNNPNALYEASKPYGLGQLTTKGKQRAFRLGQFIRRRYDSIIPKQYNMSEIYIESTDTIRTKVTALIAMSAVFPPTPENTSDNTIVWDPVPYTTTARNYDPNKPLDNCLPYVKFFYDQSIHGSFPNFTKYNDVLTQIKFSLNLENILNLDLNQHPGIMFLIYDMMLSQMSLGVPIDENLEKILPKIEEAAAEAMSLMFADFNKNALMSGVLLNEFFTHADLIISGKNTPKVRIYSSHDINIFALEHILHLTPKQGVPKYASLLSLELRRDRSGKVFVLPVYLPTPEEPEKYLQVEGCDGLLCSLERFTEITSKYALDIDTWRDRCNWNVSVKFDLKSLLDPRVIIK